MIAAALLIIVLAGLSAPRGRRELEATPHRRAAPASATGASCCSTSSAASGPATLAEPFTLTLCDLNGFKHYNDISGTTAGDALLLRLGHALGAAVEPLGARAYRQGGDEFCVIADAHRRDEVELAVCAALAESGDGFEISTAFGTAIVPLEARNASEALRRADEAMYAQKQSSRTSAGRGDQRRAPAGPVRAPSGPRRPHGRRRRAGRAGRRAARGRRRGTRPAAARRRAARHRQGRDPRRDHHQGRPAGRRRVGVHPPAHADRRAHRRRGAVARPGRAARAFLARGVGRQGLSRCAGRRGDPVRRSHRRGLRCLRRDDLDTAVRGSADRRAGPCRAAPPVRARSSTRRWSTPSNASSRIARCCPASSPPPDRGRRRRPRPGPDRARRSWRRCGSRAS